MCKCTLPAAGQAWRCNWDVSAAVPLVWLAVWWAHGWWWLATCCCNMLLARARACQPLAETGNCRGLTPQVFPNFGASSLFVYHPNAVSQWRRHVISFALASIVPEADRARFATLWDEIAGMQLGSTLTYLAPANAIGLFPVTVNTAPFRGK